MTEKQQIFTHIHSLTLSQVQGSKKSFIPWDTKMTPAPLIFIRDLTKVPLN